jgi:hypothetical protein
MKLQPEETLIIGNWVLAGGRMLEDASSRRIHTLTNGYLKRIASTSGGWETLYRDPTDGRYWEITYPLGEMHGGGPPTLRLVDGTAVREKYSVEPE